MSQGDDQTDVAHARQEPFDHGPLWLDFCRPLVQSASGIVVGSLW